MRAHFKYKDHDIVVERGITETKLLIDNQVQDVKKGTFSTQLTNYELKGEIANPEGGQDQVRVSIKIGWLKDDVILFYNGKEIESMQVRA